MDLAHTTDNQKGADVAEFSEVIAKGALERGSGDM